MIFNIIIRGRLKLIEPTNSIIFFLIEFERMKNEQNEIVPYPSRERISSKMRTKFNELIDSCSPLPKSGREIRNKRSAEAGPSEIYSPRPVEVNGGMKRYRERERRESAVKRSMVSLRFTLRETLATVIRLCSIHIRGEGEKLARRSSSPAPLPASIPFLVRIRSHSIIPRRISNEMGTGFA